MVNNIFGAKDNFAVDRRTDSRQELTDNVNCVIFKDLQRWAVEKNAKLINI